MRRDLVLLQRKDFDCNKSFSQAPAFVVRKFSSNNDRDISYAREPNTLKHNADFNSRATDYYNNGNNSVISSNGSKLPSNGGRIFYKTVQPSQNENHIRTILPNVNNSNTQHKDSFGANANLLPSTTHLPAANSTYYFTSPSSNSSSTHSQAQFNQSPYFKNAPNSSFNSISSPTSVVNGTQSSSSASSPLNSSTSPPEQAPPVQRYRTTTTTIQTSNSGGSRNGERGSDNCYSSQNNMERTPHPPRRTSTLPADNLHRGPKNKSSYETDVPTYKVEHLASFAVGPQFGLQMPSDGVQKLLQMEKNNAVFAQPMILKLLPDQVLVEEEDGTFIEQFWMDLIVDPTAHQSSDPADIFNNILLFTVKNDERNGKLTPTEMHMFQCNYISSQDVAENLHYYIKGKFYKVKSRLHNSSASTPKHRNPSSLPIFHGHRNGQNIREDTSRGSDYFEMDVNTLNRCFDDIERFVSRIQSAAVAQRELEHQHQRLQQLDKKSLKKVQAQQMNERSILQLRAQMPMYNEFYEIFQKFKLCLNLLAKLKDHIHEPNATELLHFLFTPLTVTFDACHWSMGRNVGEQVVSPLLTFDACELLRNCLTPKEYDVWMALGKTWRTPPEDWLGVLPPPFRPVFSDGFAPYGASGFVPESLGQPYCGNNSHQRYSSAPAPIHRGVSAPPPPSTSYYNGPLQHSSLGFYRQNNGVAQNSSFLDLDRINLEKERLEFERMKVLDREQQLLEQERRLRHEEIRLEKERRLFHKEAEKQSITGSDRPDFYRLEKTQLTPRMDRRMTGSVQALSSGHISSHQAFRKSSNQNNSINVKFNNTYEVSRPPTMGSSIIGNTNLPSIALTDQNPRQKTFFEELQKQRCKIVQVTYDRAAQNPKELTVARGEYLKNWWECRNVHNRLGFVPHTILTVIGQNNYAQDSTSVNEPLFVSPGNNGANLHSAGGHFQTPINNDPPFGPITGSSIINDDATPDYIKQRQGKRGEFRYF